MANPVEVVTVERSSIAVVRRVAPRHVLSSAVPTACGDVWNVLRGAGFTATGRNVAVYVDGQVTFEAGVEILSPFLGSGEVIVSATPGGRAAHAVHMGPYGQMHQAHTALRDWVRQNGLRDGTTNWEVYGHWQAHWASDPSQIRTDIYYLLG